MLWVEAGLSSVGGGGGVGVETLSPEETCARETETLLKKSFEEQKQKTTRFKKVL